MKTICCYEESIVIPSSVCCFWNKPFFHSTETSSERVGEKKLTKAIYTTIHWMARKESKNYNTKTITFIVRPRAHVRGKSQIRAYNLFNAFAVFHLHCHIIHMLVSFFFASFDPFFAHYVGIHMEIVLSTALYSVYRLWTTFTHKVENQDHNYGWQIIFKLFKW